MVALDPGGPGVGSQVQGDGAFHQTGAKIPLAALRLQRGGVRRLGHGGSYRLHRAQGRRFGAVIAQKAAEVHRVAQDVPFLFQIRSHHHAAVGHIKQLVVAGYVQNCHVGHHRAGPNPRIPVDHRLQQCACLEHPLDEHGPRSGADQLHRSGGTAGVVPGVQHLTGVQLLAQTAGNGQNFLPVPHQNGTDQPVPPSGEHRLKGVLVMGRRHYRRLGRQIAELRFQFRKASNNHMDPLFCDCWV